MPQPPGRPCLRLVLAVSLDGRLAPPEGGAAQLGGRGDRRVLEEALAWADGCLIGAETLRRHGTTCLIHAPDLLEQRARQGRPPQPVAIAVSRLGCLPPELPFFRQPLERWLLVAGQPAESPLGFLRTLPLPNWPEALAQLARLGLERVAVLGGARLARSLLEADRLDELQLTLCPRLLGGTHLWLPPGATGAGVSPWRLLEQRTLGGDEVLLRYGRGSGGSGPDRSSS
ncbi:RibD family protein [Cyanobium sp. FGCU-52]|nr:RibD family protein [Cyanobium sp. FGCU52]